MTHRVKRRDRPTTLGGRCQDKVGPVDISQASRVRLLVRGPIPSKAVALDKDVVIADLGPVADPIGNTRGKWTYAWAAADLDRAPGLYEVEVEVSWPSGRVSTFPTEGYEQLSVNEDIA